MPLYLTNHQGASSAIHAPRPVQHLHGDASADGLDDHLDPAQARALERVRQRRARPRLLVE